MHLHPSMDYWYRSRSPPSSRNASWQPLFTVYTTRSGYCFADCSQKARESRSLSLLRHARSHPMRLDSMLDGDGHDQPSFVRVYSPSLCLCFVVVLEYCSCSSPHHQTLNSPLPQLLSADRCPFAAFLERSAALQ